MRRAKKKMVTTQNQKRKSAKPELGLQKSSHANTIGDLESDDLSDTILLNGEVIQVAPDLKDLPEIDETDPEVQKWMEEEDKKYREKFPNITRQEAYERVRETKIDTS
ncbi:MAG: hypothetical protein HY391_03120 [Deltaproteobacteria bacterium]|nr:hypothetical protein [Deltaproteobacteria bacterium]